MDNEVPTNSPLPTLTSEYGEGEGERIQGGEAMLKD
jgi:hypothetical protein